MPTVAVYRRGHFLSPPFPTARAGYQFVRVEWQTIGTYEYRSRFIWITNTGEETVDGWTTAGPLADPARWTRLDTPVEGEDLVSGQGPITRGQPVRYRVKPHGGNY